MKNENFIIINGKKYDSVTGKPILTEPQKRSTQLADTITKKSKAIYQHATKRATHATLSRKPGRNMDIARSQSVTKFKPTVAQKKEVNTTTPVVHPVVSMGQKRQALIRNHLAVQKQKNVPKTPQTIKEEAITKALEQPIVKQKEKTIFGRHKKALLITTALLITVCTTYCIYTYVPSFSVKVASAQAGINATFPSYYPDGYSLSGPVTSNSSQVNINFKSNTDKSYFNIRQTRSTWDSTAVKNMVTKKSKDNVFTIEERGLTIFIYNGNAAWVNGGILYEIIGNAPLSNYQVRKIATSL